MEFLFAPWPWYVCGPLIGLTVPLLLLLGGKTFGISSSLRHICAATYPKGIEYLSYNWRERGHWLLLFVAGLLIGGWIGGNLLRPENSVEISNETVTDLAKLGIADIQGLAPASLFSWHALVSWPGVFFLIFGGFMVGFGARWANGCTSGHSILGIANFQWNSLLATGGFFIGGLFTTFVILPLLF
ncbi:MAG: YeeE/YedE family protein [Calditrichaeota bacterium]|nr:YeeE/YedE family protein [Calditrichota bacterium]MCB9368933.1 YeeE/YedE family protein [Calditrichota bacterium]